MKQPHGDQVNSLAARIEAEIAALPVQNTPSVRQVRRKVFCQLRGASPEYALALAQELIPSHRWVAYELIAAHEATFKGKTVAWVLLPLHFTPITRSQMAFASDR